jgi:hypothetical protein
MKTLLLFLCLIFVVNLQGQKTDIAKLYITYPATEKNKSLILDYYLKNKNDTCGIWPKSPKNDSIAKLWYYRDHKKGIISLLQKMESIEMIVPRIAINDSIPETDYAVSANYPTRYEFKVDSSITRVDTIKALMLLCDTAEAKSPYMIKYPFVMYEKGFSITNNGFNVKYLDSQKQPLKRGIIVWISKEIKP